MCPFRSHFHTCTHARTHARTHTRTLSLSLSLSLSFSLSWFSSFNAILHYLQVFRRSRRYNDTSIKRSLAVIHTRSWDATLWRALTGSFFNALAEVKPKISRDQWLHNKKKKGFRSANFSLGPWYHFLYYLNPVQTIVRQILHKVLIKDSMFFFQLLILIFPGEKSEH